MLLVPHRRDEERRRCGIVPDALVLGMPPPRDAPPAQRLAFRQIADVKVLHGSGHADYHTRVARSARGGGVGHRADAMQREYRQHALELDQEHHTGVGGAAGPISALLDTMPLWCWGWGAFAEASVGVHVLASHCADTGAAMLWRSMGCRSEAEARGFLVARIRRQWGVAAALAAARLVVWRLGTVGMTQLPDLGEQQRAPRDAAERSLRVSERMLQAAFLQGEGPIVHPYAP